MPLDAELLRLDITVLIWEPKDINAAINASPTKEEIRAYSTRPCPLLFFLAEDFGFIFPLKGLDDD